MEKLFIFQHPVKTCVLLGGKRGSFSPTESPAIKSWPLSTANLTPNNLLLDDWINTSFQHECFGRGSDDNEPGANVVTSNSSFAWQLQLRKGGELCISRAGLCWRPFKSVLFSQYPSHINKGFTKGLFLPVLHAYCITVQHTIPF